MSRLAGAENEVSQDLKRQLLFLEDDKVRAEGGGGFVSTVFWKKTVVYLIIYDGFQHHPM